MLLSLAWIFLGALIMGSLAQRLKLPDLVGMLLTGILMGPYGLDLLAPELLGSSADIRQMALVIILMRAGLSLDLTGLKKIGRPAVLMGFIPASFEMASLILLAPLLFDLPLLDAAILAAVIASASPAVIVPRMVTAIETGYGSEKGIPQLILAGATVDDIFNIVVFSSLLGLATGANGGGMHILRFAEIPVAILLGIMGGIAAGWGMAKVFQRTHLRDTAKVIALLCLAFFLIGIEGTLAGFISFSGLLAVMTTGVILLRNIPATAKGVSKKFSKLWVGAEILLFVLVGASMDISFIPSAGLRTLLLLAIVLIFRAMGILVCLIKTDLNWKERLFCVLAGIPKATVQAAIGGIPLAMGLPNGGIILSVAVITILFTAPIGAFLIDRTYKVLLSRHEV